MKMFRKDEGFTLVELMVVVLIIGILVAIAVPVFLNASASAKAKSCQANQRTIVGAIQTYNAQNPTAVIADAAATTPAAGEIGTSGDYSALFGTSGTIKTPPVCNGTGGGAYSGYGVSVVSDKSAYAGTTGTKDFITDGSYEHELGL